MKLNQLIVCIFLMSIKMYVQSAPSGPPAPKFSYLKRINYTDPNACAILKGGNLPRGRWVGSYERSVDVYSDGSERNGRISRDNCKLLTAKEERKVVSCEIQYGVAPKGKKWTGTYTMVADVYPDGYGIVTQRIDGCSLLMSKEERKVVSCEVQKGLPPIGKKWIGDYTIVSLVFPDNYSQEVQRIDGCSLCFLPNRQDSFIVCTGGYISNKTPKDSILKGVYKLVYSIYKEQNCAGIYGSWQPLLSGEQCVLPSGQEYRTITSDKGIELNSRNVVLDGSTGSWQPVLDDKDTYDPNAISNGKALTKEIENVNTAEQQDK